MDWTHLLCPSQHPRLSYTHTAPHTTLHPTRTHLSVHILPKHAHTSLHAYGDTSRTHTLCSCTHTLHTHTPWRCVYSLSTSPVFFPHTHTSLHVYLSLPPPATHRQLHLTPCTHTSHTRTHLGKVRGAVDVASRPVDIFTHTHTHTHKVTHTHTYTNTHARTHTRTQTHTPSHAHGSTPLHAHLTPPTAMHAYLTHARTLGKSMAPCIFPMDPSGFLPIFMTRTVLSLNRCTRNALQNTSLYYRSFSLHYRSFTRVLIVGNAAPQPETLFLQKACDTFWQDRCTLCIIAHDTCSNLCPLSDTRWCPDTSPREIRKSAHMMIGGT